MGVDQKVPDTWDDHWFGKPLNRFDIVGQEYSSTPISFSRGLATFMLMEGFWAHLPQSLLGLPSLKMVEIADERATNTWAWIARFLEQYIEGCIHDAAALTQGAVKTCAQGSLPFTGYEPKSR